MTERIKHIDVAKGITIIFVVLAHNPAVQFSEFLNTVFKPLNIPFFFLLAGLFLRTNKSPFELFINKTNSLLKPFLSTLLIAGFIKYFYQEIDLVSYFFSSFYGNGATITWTPLWFLPHLWLLVLTSYLLNYYLDFESMSKKAKIIFLLILLLVGHFALDLFWNLEINFSNATIVLPGLPFSSDIIILSSFYFLLGYFFRNHFLKFKPKQAILLFSIILYSVLYTNTDCLIDFNVRRFDHIIFSTLASFSCIYIILSISYFMTLFSLSNALFTFTGGMTLYILLFHYPLQYQLFLIFDSSGLNTSTSGILALFFSVLFTSVTGYIIRQTKVLLILFEPSQRKAITRSIVSLKPVKYAKILPMNLQQSKESKL